jgi:hypothetical protein
MPSPSHEALHHLFRNDPELITHALREISGMDLEVIKATELNIDTTELRPLERRSDTVLELELADHGSCIMVVESQTDPDEEKITAWPQLVSHLYAKYRRPVGLVVITQKPATAAWARRPIRCGLPGLPDTLLVTPHVIGPDRTPKVTNLTDARRSAVSTVLSVAVHGRSPDSADILGIVVDVLGTIDTDKAVHYADLIRAALSNPLNALTWEKLMKTSTQPFISSLRDELREEGREEGRVEGRVEGREEGREEGRVEGEIKALLLVLERRSIDVTDEARARITACADTQRLETWMHRAFDISVIDELFA